VDELDHRDGDAAKQLIAIARQNGKPAPCILPG